ncbi:fimbrial protein [Escherichia coli]|uniref:fimbrial protein n=1 Tax=Escherichia coli TaxID=562 RepID=UPI00049FD253|nr:fimbrial protein [Escherichia coli]EGP5909235.1 fimbrial protein [Escherichia coli]EGP5916931.1 fimbrial protein [Escherichia coli]EHL1106022.1 fimbrial protein [Escherichia coli]ELO4950911.1 fimbrial protein [Escherichia coli]KDA57425.1 fimbrial family protein [Escherichia coli 2-011-08_S1_C1]
MKKHLLLLLCTCGGVALAAGDDITFHGTLVAPPACAISDGKTLEVEFRDLIIDSINGDYGRKEVVYGLSCDSDTRDPEWNMTLTWTGTQTAYNDSAIETDVPGFGIELQHDGQPFKLNTPLTINATDFTQKPKLEAVPVKSADAVLSDTTFSAYATLRVDYQ